MTQPVRPAPLRLVPPPWLDEHDGHNGPPGGEQDRRPTVVLGSNTYENATALDAALGAVAPDLFQRSMELVEVVTERRPQLVAPGTPVLVRMNAPALGNTISQFLQCVKWAAPSKAAIKRADMAGSSAKPSLQPTRPTADLALLPLLNFRRWEHIRPISGITEAPLFRPDGTILQGAEPAYDEPTGYLYRPNAMFPPVPDSPTQDDARRAYLSLQHVFCDFPYVSEAAAAVPIAALFTILARAAIFGPVPAHGFEASVQGSGKTKQCEVVHIVATGRAPPTRSFTVDDERQRQELLALALGGSAVCFYDNVKGFFGGAALEAMLTSGEIVQRMLGRNEDTIAQCRAVVLVSGNNMRPSEDMSRRMLISRLEPDSEDPTRGRKFVHDPLIEWVRRERPRLIVDALTVLRAYALKGYPDAGTGIMASFEAWSRIVPGAIVFAGGPNVLETIGTAQTISDESAAVAVVMRELPRLSKEPISSKGIIDALYPIPGPHDPPDGWDEMREALEVLCPVRNGPSPKAQAVGEALSARKGQVSAGMRLCRQVGHTKRVLWSVQPVTRAALPLLR